MSRFSRNIEVLHIVKTASCTYFHYQYLQLIFLTKNWLRNLRNTSLGIYFFLVFNKEKLQDL